MAARHRENREKGPVGRRSEGNPRRDGEVLRGDYQEAERTPINTEILPDKRTKKGLCEVTRKEEREREGRE